MAEVRKASEINPLLVLLITNEPWHPQTYTQNTPVSTFVTIRHFQCLTLYPAFSL